jgi:hypothetical protein
MRGERLRTMLQSMGYSGSSPHARGTPIRPIRRGHGRRFIPACAGNAPFPRSLVPDLPVHPRMRGERGHGAPSLEAVTGSSPHAPGTRLQVVPRRASWRFIPACAGNAVDPRVRSSRAPVHPRMRGERLSRDALVRALLRFIPACAGNASLIAAHGFFSLDALPENTTPGTRARIAEVMLGAPLTERW